MKKIVMAIFCFSLFYMVPSYAVDVTYEVHSEDGGGWLAPAKNGKSTRMLEMIDGIKIMVNGLPSSCRFQYRVSAGHIGYMPWKYNGEVAGTTKGRNWFEAIEIMLIGCSGYTLKYKAYSKKLGWRDWRYSGEIAGTTGQSLPIKAIKIILEKT